MYCRVGERRVLMSMEKMRDADGLAFQHNIAGDLSARTKSFLGLPVQLRLYSARVAECEHELILSFPLGLFAWTQQRLLRTSAIDLNDHPTELRRFQVQNQGLL